MQKSQGVISLPYGSLCRKPVSDRRQTGMALPNYLVFRIFFIWVLVLVDSMVEYGTVFILMIYLANVVEQRLLTIAIIISASEGLSSVLKFVLAYIADNFTNRFNVIVFSMGSYIMGLLLSWISSFSSQEIRMLNVAVILIALGKSGGGSTLKSFLKYQLKESNNTPETAAPHPSKENRRTNICWHSARITGYIIAMLFDIEATNLRHLKISFVEIFKISALIMLAALVVFFSGFPAFDHECPTKTPFTEIVRDLNAATSNKIHLWWATFFPYSLVLVTGNSLFLAQVTNLNVRIGRNFTVPFASFFVLKSLLSDIVVFLLRGKGTGIRIGLGLICSVFCCIAAWVVELSRLDIINKEGLMNYPLEMSSMSVLWLIPQYAILGLMEGLAGGGLETLIYNHLPCEKKCFAEPLSELVLCSGKFGSILVMSFCNFWFGKSINTSQMDEYFLMLAIFCTLLFVFCLLWWRNLVINNTAHGESETAQPEVGNDQQVQDNSSDNLDVGPPADDTVDLLDDPIDVGPPADDTVDLLDDPINGIENAATGEDKAEETGGEGEET